MSKVKRPRWTNDVVSWLGWHVGELAGVIAPGVLALMVTPWAAVVSGLVGVSWVVHEVRLARRQRAVRSGRVRPVLTAGRSEEDTPDTAVGWGEGR